MKTKADSIQAAEKALIEAKQAVMEVPWRADHEGFMGVVDHIDDAVKGLRKIGKETRDKG